MVKRRVDDREKHIHFATFSCYKRQQPRYSGINIWLRFNVEGKLEDIHMNPVRAGIVERMTDWQWCSARWYVENRTVGLPIRWPPGLEADDDFAVH